MTTLLAFQNNSGHCNSFRTFFVFVYDILGDCWSWFMTFWDIFSSFMTTLAVVENTLFNYISFRTFLVLLYDISEDFRSSLMTTLVAIQNN